MNVFSIFTNKLIIINSKVLNYFTSKKYKIKKHK